jgi:hypothetical protein
LDERKKGNKEVGESSGSPGGFSLSGRRHGNVPLEGRKMHLDGK